MAAAEASGGFARLTQLTAGDLIGGAPIAVPTTATMLDAARVLAEHHIGIAPVVDADGTCVGVLGLRDFVNYELDRVGDHAPARKKNVHPPGDTLVRDWSVQRFMATAVQSVPFDAPLKQVIEMMLGSKLHHLVVLDKAGKPIGVLSTLDVLSAFNAMDDEHRVGGAKPRPSQP